MKGYQIENVLYIFSQEAAQIPSVAETVEAIAIQPEMLEAFKALNEDYADIMVPYNYNTMTVNAKPWAGHADDDIEVPKVSPELAWSANSATVTINADDNVYPTLTNPNSVTVAYTSSDTEKATIDASDGTITLVAAGDTTISAVFEGDDTYEAQTVTYTLTVNAETEPEILPEVGTEYNLAYYANKSDETPIAEGTLTYLGVLPHNNNYIYGNLTIPGQEITGYIVIAKSDLSKVDTGTKFVGYTVDDLEDTTLESSGYGVISTKQ